MCTQICLNRLACPEQRFAASLRLVTIALQRPEGSLREAQQERYFAGEPSVSPSETSSVPFVPETAFGIWFLRTYTWEHHVLRVAINDLKRLIDTPLPRRPVIVDAGCGQGISFKLLATAFEPSRIVGIDYHEASLALAAGAARACGNGPAAPQFELLHGDCAALPLPDASTDILFCH